MPNNLRTIKKDVDYFVEEVVSDTCLFMAMNPGKNEDKATQIIEDAIDLRNAMYDRINNVQDNPVKPYFKAINKDFLENLDKLYERISSLTK